MPASLPRATDTSSDVRPCSDVRWHRAASRRATPGVRQVANGSDGVDLVIPGDATCATQADCDSLAAGRGDTQITFRPDILETPSETPSEG